MEQGPHCTLLPFHQLFKFRAVGRQCQGRANNAHQHQDSLIRFSLRHSGTGPPRAGTSVSGQGKQCSSLPVQSPKIQPQALRYTLLKFLALRHQCQDRTDKAPQHQDSLIRFSLRHSGTRSSSSGAGEVSVRAGQIMLLNTRTVS